MKKIILTVFAVIVLGFGIYYGYDYYAEYKIGYTTVYVASHNISQRTLLEEKDIKEIKMPKDYISKQVFTEKNEIVGKYVKLSYSIPNGSFFYKGALETDIKDLANSLLKEGEVNYDFYVSDIRINTAHLDKNMYLDLYLTIDKVDKVISDLLISNVRITGFYDSYGKEILNYNNDSRVYAVSVAVSKEDVSVINKALVVGTLNCVVNSNTYTDLGKTVQNKESDIYDYLI